jgi:hypothetical protein
MKTLTLNFLVLAIALISFTANSQTVEIRKTSPFSRIQTGGSWDVILQKGDQEEVRLETQQFDLSKVKTEVNNNTLEISLEKGNYRNVDITVYVTYRDLEYIKSSGSGNLKSNNDLMAEDLEIVMTGSGNTTLKEINADKLTVSMSGSGNMKVEGGSVGTLSLKQTGSGNFNAMELAAANTEVSKSGSGNAYFTANETISVRSTGSGDVQYKGNATISDVRTTGSGRLVKNR